MSLDNGVRASELLLSLFSPEGVTPTCRTDGLEQLISEAKKKAVERGDQDEAALLWQCQTIASIQRNFIAAFASLKADEFYEAWCSFERCEVEMLGLLRHYCVPPDDPHRIEYIRIMADRWQKLYPYKVFFSPEILKKKVVCSICGSPVLPRLKCEHKKWEIYNGELCHHRVIDAEILGISLVEEPVQRYSVAFVAADDTGKQRDHYNYGNVRFVVQRLASAFHSWRSQVTTRVIQKMDVAHLTRDDPCPCLSGKTFGDCCADKTEITVPHLQFHLAVPCDRKFPDNEFLF